MSEAFCIFHRVGHPRQQWHVSWHNALWCSMATTAPNLRHNPHRVTTSLPLVLYEGQTAHISLFVTQKNRSKIFYSSFKTSSITHSTPSVEATAFLDATPDNPLLAQSCDDRRWNHDNSIRSLIWLTRVVLPVCRPAEENHARQTNKKKKLWSLSPFGTRVWVETSQCTSSCGYESCDSDVTPTRTQWPTQLNINGDQTPMQTRRTKWHNVPTSGSCYVNCMRPPATQASWVLMQCLMCGATWSWVIMEEPLINLNAFAWNAANLVRSFNLQSLLC